MHRAFSEVAKTILGPASALAFLAATLVLAGPAAQDNWTLDSNFPLSAGAVAASSAGVNGGGFPGCVGRDGQLYIVVQLDGSDPYSGNYVVHIYDKYGSYAGQIDWGHNFRCITAGADGNIYMYDNPSTPDHSAAQNIVRVYDTAGHFIRSTDLGVTTFFYGFLAVDSEGNIYVGGNLDHTGKIDVYSPDGAPLRQIGSGVGDAALVTNLNTIRGLAIGPDDTVSVLDVGTYATGGYDYFIHTFSPNGEFLRRFIVPANSQHNWGVAVGSDGLLYLLSGAGSYGDRPLSAYNQSGEQVFAFGRPNVGTLYYLQGGAVDPMTGMVYLLQPVSDQQGNFTGTTVQAWRRGFRTLGANPPRLVPMPGIRNVTQRVNSWVDIDYTVTDGDSAAVTVAAVAYRNGTGLLRDLVPLTSSALQEGTAVSAGADVSTGSVHRLTWNPASAGVPSGNLTFEVLARDDRPGLIDFDFITLPGSPTLTISRTPLTHADLRPVWAWLLATGDPALSRAGDGEITGPGGVFTTTFNNNGTLESRTTAAGRAWLLAKLGVREAAGAEVTRARQGSSPGNPNQFTPGASQQMGTRPAKVNEWGFDSSDQYGTEAWWVVR